MKKLLLLMLVAMFFISLMPMMIIADTVHSHEETYYMPPEPEAEEGLSKGFPACECGEKYLYKTCDGTRHHIGDIAGSHTKNGVYCGYYYHYYYARWQCAKCGEYEFITGVYHGHYRYHNICDREKVCPY